MAKTVVILGGSYVAISTAHKLLKNTLPRINDLQVILVSPTTHLYWNVASPRAILPNGFKSDDEVFQPIAPSFAKYPEGSFTLVEGKAESVDPEGHTVVVSVSSGQQTYSYDQLVVATGASLASGLPFKQMGSYKDMLESLHALRKKIADAQSIALAGAGPTGVETAGELGYEYSTKGKKITLITDSKDVLPGLMESVRNAAEKELEKLQVQIVHSTRVTNAMPKDSQTELTLSSGDKLLVDLYLPTVGVMPNTSFLPKDLLDERGNLRVDKYFKVESATDIWACGDVTNVQVKQLAYANKQVPYLAKNLDAVLSGNPGDLSEYKKDDTIVQAVPIGRGGGTGQMGDSKLPSILIWKGKSRDYLTPKLRAFLTNGVISDLDARVLQTLLAAQRRIFTSGTS
jgi:NADH dehydrogenase FAD-containing subunit